MLKYRADISGIRALAVLSVLIYHADLDVFGYRLLPAGFFGVDIFFVLSGYLISYLVLEQIERGEFSFLQFYHRRARRILPALFAMLVFSIPFAFYLLHPNALVAFSKSLVAAVASVSNFVFWLEDSYTAEASQLKPLLHTWSLGIEEQFYLVLPLLLIMLNRLSSSERTIKITLWVLLVGSLICAQLTAIHASTFGFFVLPSRIWEFVCGTLLALSHLKHGLPAPTMRSRVWVYVGFLAVLVPMFVYDDGVRHPSTFTLSTVVGTVLLIRFGTTPSLVKSVLSWGPIVYIGLISYSLYLLHWPILVFARHAFIELGYGQTVLLIAVSFACAALSYRFVDTPFREQRLGAKPLYLTLLTSGLVMVVFALWAISGGGLIDRFRDRPVLYATFLDMQRVDRGETYDPDCYFHFELDGDLTEHPFENCLVLDDNRQNIVLMGDSMVAYSSFWGVKSIVDPATTNVVFTGMAGCRPVFDYGRNENCRARNDRILAFAAENEIDLLILAGGWRNPDVIQNNLVDTLEYLKTAGQNTVVIGAPLQFERKLPDVYDIVASQTGSFQGASMIVPEYFAADELMQDVVPASGFQYISLTTQICLTGLVEDCRLTYDDVLLTADRGHLPPTAAEHLFSQYKFDDETSQIVRRELK